MSDRGLVMVYTGNGKGKTTAALGLALRRSGHGGRVVMIQFMKGRTYGELKAAEHVPGLEIIMAGRDVFVDRDNPEEIDIKMAREALVKAQKLALSGQVDMLILDEVNVAMDYGLLTIAEILDLMNTKSPAMDLVLTGRGAPPAIVKAADMVSEVLEIKHHYHEGIDARHGIEF